MELGDGSRVGSAARSPGLASALGDLFDDCEIAANRASGEAGCIAADFATHNAARQLILKSLRTWFFCLVRQCRADHRNGADAQGDEERLHRRIAQPGRRAALG